MASHQHGSADNEVRRTPAPKKKKKKHSKAFIIFKKLMTVIATTLLSLLLVIIITGTIVSTALTVYVLNFMDDSTNVTLQQLESGSDTYFYGNQTNEAGEKELVQIHTIQNDFQRIPVDIERIPQHVRNAFVYTEDERFYVHDGVDYKRTFSAFANMFLHFYDTEQGGSTITQQLVKNLSGDDEHTPQRKIREIFSAMQLEKTYSKDEILEEYLNYIGFGGPINGIQLASIRYFGKNVEQLTVPEAAVLAAIPKSPEEYGPFVEYHRDNDPKEPVVINEPTTSHVRNTFSTSFTRTVPLPSTSTSSTSKLRSYILIRRNSKSSIPSTTPRSWRKRKRPTAGSWTLLTMKQSIYSWKNTILTILRL